MVIANNGSIRACSFLPKASPVSNLRRMQLSGRRVCFDNGGDFIGVIYAGNLWIVDAASGQSQQVTGDGLTTNIDWK